MNDDDLAAIKARHLRDERWRYSPSMICPQMHDDRAALLAEVERLRQENQHHRVTAMDRVSRGLHDAAIAEQATEIERLRAMLPPTAHSGVRNGPGEGSWSVFAEKAVQERDAARAEVERLRDEVERLHQAHQAACEGGDLLLAEVERLRAENERLREALTDMLNGWLYVRETYGDLARVGWDRAEQKARNALKDTQ